jgi:DNA end-binding protein Ku
VPRAQIDENYIDTPYFLAPDGKVAEEAFAVIREAMKERDVVGLGRVVLYRRERIVMLEPRGKGLVARTLRYAYEVRSEDEVFDDIGDVKIEPEMLKLAAHIIDTKLSDFDPKQFEDRYQNALLEIIRAKAGHKPIKRAPEAPPPSNVVSLMDALRKSVAAESGGTKPAARRNPSPARGKSATTGRKGSGRAKTGARRAS